MSPRTITREQHFAALLLHCGAVVVPSPEDAQRWLDEHRRTTNSWIADLAQQIHARRKEFQLSGYLRAVSANQSTQLSYIRDGLMLIFTAAAAGEAVLCLDGPPEEVTYGDERELAKLMS